jgi:hypothetical protein
MKTISDTIKEEVSKALDENLDNINEIHKGTIEAHKLTAKIFVELIKVIDKLSKVIGVVVFCVVILLYRVFLFDSLNNTISRSIKSWSGLSEGWKIFIVGIPVAISVQIIGSLLTKKIENSLKIQDSQE